MEPSPVTWRGAPPAEVMDPKVNWLLAAVVNPLPVVVATVAGEAEPPARIFNSCPLARVRAEDSADTLKVLLVKRIEGELLIEPEPLKASVPTSIRVMPL